MIALPIVVRELSVAARKASTYQMRLGGVLAAIAFGTYEMYVFRATLGGTGGGSLFKTFAIVLLVYCVIVAMRNSIDSVCREKREGTLGLLFLTDLRSYDVVLGKLFAIGLHSFYGFLGAFPILGVSLLLGGVTGTEFFRTSLAILNVLFVVHAIGLACSTFCREARHSYLLATGISTLLFGVPYGLKLILDRHGWFYAGEMAWIFSPLYSFFNTIPKGADFFWNSLLQAHALGWLFLGASCLYLPRSWQEGSDRWLVHVFERFKLWCHGTHEQRKSFRARVIDTNPFYWLVSRSRVVPYFVWGLIVCFALAWVVIYFGARHWLGVYWNSARIPILLGTICLLHTLLKIWIASESIRHLELQRRGGFLELLLTCTPLQVPEIIHGHWMALQRQFFGPVIFVLLVDAGILLAYNDSSDRLIPAAMLSLMVMLCADCVAIGWVGMWMGLSTERAGFAFGKTFWRILVFPWLAFFLVGGGIAFLTGSLAMALGGWTVLGVFNAIFFGIQAENGLSRHFRLLSSMQNKKPGILQHINPLNPDSVWRKE